LGKRKGQSGGRFRKSSGAIPTAEHADSLSMELPSVPKHVSRRAGHAAGRQRAGREREEHQGEGPSTAHTPAASDYGSAKGAHRAQGQVQLRPARTPSGWRPGQGLAPLEKLSERTIQLYKLSKKLDIDEGSGFKARQSAGRAQHRHSRRGQRAVAAGTDCKAYTCCSGSHLMRIHLAVDWCLQSLVWC